MSSNAGKPCLIFRTRWWSNKNGRHVANKGYDFTSEPDCMEALPWVIPYIRVQISKCLLLENRWDNLPVSVFRRTSDNVSRFEAPSLKRQSADFNISKYCTSCFNAMQKCKSMPGFEYRTSLPGTPSDPARFIEWQDQCLRGSCDY